jgi:hypothetical protein
MKLRRTHAIGSVGLAGLCMFAAGAAATPPVLCSVVCGNEQIDLGECDPPTYCCYYYDCIAKMGNFVCCTQSQQCIVDYGSDPPPAGCY